MVDLPVYFYKVRAHDGFYWAYLCPDQGVFRYERNVRLCARDIVGISQKCDKPIRRIFSTPPISSVDEISGHISHREDWVALPLSWWQKRRYNKEIDKALKGG
mgnify:CR=1 FL=1